MTFNLATANWPLGSHSRSGAASGEPYLRGNQHRAEGKNRLAQCKVSHSKWRLLFLLSSRQSSLGLPQIVINQNLNETERMTPLAFINSARFQRLKHTGGSKTLQQHLCRSPLRFRSSNKWWVALIKDVINKLDHSLYNRSMQGSGKCATRHRSHLVPPLAKSSQGTLPVGG